MSWQELRKKNRSRERPRGQRQPVVAPRLTGTGVLRDTNGTTPPATTETGPSAAESANGTLTLTLDQAIELAQRKQGAGDLRSAEAICRKILDVQPQRAEARNLLAQIIPLVAYQKRVLRMRNSPYLDYPAHVHMETLSLCNAACDFCPYMALERKGEKMSDELIQKIIDDLTDIPSSLRFQLSPFKVNEPFLDKRIFDVLEMINQRLPNASITMTSNASPITKEKLDRLARVRNIGYLWLSINDHRPGHYEATMQLPFARTMERLELIHRKKATGELSCRVVLSRVGDKTPSDAEFVQWVHHRYPHFEASIFQRGGWLGQVNLELGPVPTVACGRWFELSITSTGTVAHCCMDGQAKWPIGDVTKQHVLEIYNAPEYRKLRERTLTRLDAEPCSTCTFL